MRRWLTPLFAVAAVVVLVSSVVAALGARGDRQPVAATLGPHRGPAAPATGAFVGAWVQPEVYDDPGRVAAFTRFEDAAGRKLDIANEYYRWDQRFPTAVEATLARHGVIPMISWSGADASAIAAGDYDSLIEARARDVKRFGHQLFIRWFWEMDRPDQRGRASSGSEYIAAWQHIRTVFQRAGVTNVGWAWCPTAAAFASGKAAAYYPGDGWVDWVCADGYNMAPAKPGSPWRSFADIFEPFYRWAAARPLPLMIGEFGALERAPGERARWFEDMATALRERFPRIHAVVYFDSNRFGSDGIEYRWKLDGSPDAQRAFALMAREPYFNPRRIPVGGAR